MLFTLANIGGMVAYLPLLTLPLPVKIALLAGDARTTATGAGRQLLDRPPRRGVAVDPDAPIHDLSPDNQDGTAFYRHRSTGFETVDEGRAPACFDRPDAELRNGGQPLSHYIAGDTDLFELTMLAKARYGRALLHRNYLSHSGAIAPGAMLSPRSGRQPRFRSWWRRSRTDVPDAR